MTRYFTILCPFVFFILVQGQELLFHVNKIQIRALAGPFEAMKQRNLAVFLMNQTYFDLCQTEKTSGSVTLLRRQILSFDIFDISLMPLNRLVIQAFERKSGNNQLMYLHCTISEAVKNGIFTFVQSYRILKGIGLLPLSVYQLSKVWKYERLGVDNGRTDLMGSQLILLHIEDVTNVDGSRMGRRRFTIRCHDLDRWLIFSSDHFGLYPVEKTSRVFIVIAELAGTDDEELLHYYAIDTSPHVMYTFHDDLYRDTKADLNEKLADMMEPILANNNDY